MSEQIRILPLSGVKNFRDMGGYGTRDGRTVAWGRLYRSGHLSELPDDIGDAITGRNIMTVIDFRSDAEKKRHPVRWPKGWTPHYEALPIGGNAAAWVQELFERIASSPFPADELRQQFILAFETIPVKNADGLRRFFHLMAAAGPEDKGATLFHCTAGKDRTGLAGSLLLRALGVSEEEIMDDFLLTNSAVELEATSERLAGWLSERAGRAIQARDVFPLVGVERDFLHAAHKAIEREFGSLDHYYRAALDIDETRLEQLRTRFLTA